MNCLVGMFIQMLKPLEHEMPGSVVIAMVNRVIAVKIKFGLDCVKSKP